MIDYNSVSRAVMPVKGEKDAAKAIVSMRDRMPRCYFPTCQKCPCFIGVDDKGFWRCVINGKEHHCQKTKSCPADCPHYETMKRIAESADGFEKEILFG